MKIKSIAITNIDEPSLDIEVIGAQQASSSRSKQSFFAKDII